LTNPIANGGQIINGLGTPTISPQLTGVPSLLWNVASTRRSTTPAIVSHYQIQPVFDIFANVQNRDLGGVSKDVNSVLERFRKQLPPGALLYVRGQASSMNIAFGGLLSGLAFSLLLIYLLLVINFQSWVDPLIIL